jgi:alkanesulfonate monooxygenase SsuD/methylene tetrahydromethanopterin reductase-like flavin-dependent oxidoreductase (luciferase family)
MRLSLTLTDLSWRGPLRGELGAVAAAADDAGLDTLWVADHLIQADPAAPKGSAMLEAYTTLGFAAARTQRIRLGAMVSPVFLREPALLLKALATVDALAGGRTWLGLGTGYHGGEAEIAGIPFPSQRDRYGLLERTLELARSMWDGTSPLGEPRPLERPRILIGGMGERRTLRLVAEHADACNLFDIPDGGATVRHKLDVLRRHCDAVGRPFDAIEKTISTRLAAGEDARAFAARCRELRALGLEHAVVLAPGPWTPQLVAVLATAQADLQED